MKHASLSPVCTADEPLARAVRQTGGGDACLCVDGALEADLSGSGDLYSHCGADVDADESGSGSVRQE